jgi:hypothetical protein
MQLAWQENLARPVFQRLGTETFVFDLWWLVTNESRLCGHSCMNTYGSPQVARARRLLTGCTRVGVYATPQHQVRARAHARRHTTGDRSRGVPPIELASGLRPWVCGASGGDLADELHGQTCTLLLRALPITINQQVSSGSAARMVQLQSSNVRMHALVLVKQMLGSSGALILTLPCLPIPRAAWSFAMD